MPGVRPRSSILRVVAMVGLAASCQRAPRPLVANVDACDFCRMTVSDTRFGGEIETRTGRIHTFDSIECLASFHGDASERGEVRNAWVSDFESRRLVPVDSAVFMEAGSLSTPMGRGFVAFAPEHQAALGRYGGRIRRWADVRASLQHQHLEPGVPTDSGRAPDRRKPS